MKKCFNSPEKSVGHPIDEHLSKGKVSQEGDSAGYLLTTEEESRWSSSFPSNCASLELGLEII